MDGVIDMIIGVVYIGFHQGNDICADTLHFGGNLIEFPSILIDLEAIDILYINSQDMFMFGIVEDVSDMLMMIVLG